MKVACYHGTSWVSNVIRWQTRSEISHIAILDDEDGNSVYESWHRGGTLHNCNLSTRHTPGTTVDLYELNFPLTLVQKTEMRAWMRGQLGKAYDFRSVFRFVTRVNKDGAEDKLFCSEFAFMAFYQVGIELLCRIEPWRIPPCFIPLSPLLFFSERVVTV